ncbi:NAD(P)H-binding protein [Portibacter marinus]|uniref:NAD(P)H-binding protein n=1 Tax=Portibacter marinus TaxID=2898660 RepID=UPI001F418D0B|nr:NAD(P)H-binding protein [Portibacter marinus]
MKSRELEAIVIGATGLVGSELVKQLLIDDDYSKVRVLHRRPTGVKHDKLEEFIIDFDKPQTWKDLMQGNVLFSTLGTTMSAAGSKDEQYKVDYTYQYEMAKAAADNDVEHYVLVSSAGAHPKSRIFYSRMKGELEEAVKKLEFKSIHILQPSILSGDRSENRVGEKIGLALVKAVSWVPFVKKYRPIRDQEVATAMRTCVLRNNLGTHTYKLDEIFNMN